MLRHGCGYALANAGHDTRALQAWLGHKNIQHTVRYTELNLGQSRQKSLEIPQLLHAHRKAAIRSLPRLRLRLNLPTRTLFTHRPIPVHKIQHRSQQKVLPAFLNGWRNIMPSFFLQISRSNGSHAAVLRMLTHWDGW